MRADVAELMHPGIAAENCPVVYMHVPPKLRIVGEDRPVAHLAIVRDMHVGHDPVVVADAGHARVLYGSGVERTVFADGVAVADGQFGRLAAVFFVLRLFAERTELEYPVAATDPRPTGNHHMRADPGVVADFDVLADDGIRSPTPSRAAGWTIAVG